MSKQIFKQNVEKDTLRCTDTWPKKNTLIPIICFPLNMENMEKDSNPAWPFSMLNNTR